MFWMIIPALASTLPAVGTPGPDPIQRSWGGGKSCDAAVVLKEAADGVIGAPWKQLADAPHQVVEENPQVLLAWAQARDCDTIRRPKNGFSLNRFGAVMVAASREALDEDPAHAAELAVEAFAFGNDAAVGGFLSSTIGASVHRASLDVVAEAWPSLSAEERQRAVGRLRTLYSQQPGLDTLGERESMGETIVGWQAEHWLPVSFCVNAHEEALKRVEFALEQPDPRAFLDPNEARSWTEWAGGECSVGVRNVAQGWLNDQEHIEAQLRRWEGSL